MASISLGNVMLRQQYTKMFASRLPFIDEIMFEYLQAPGWVYPQVFNVRNSTRAYEEILGVAGFGQFSEKSEAGAVEYDRLIQGYSKRFTHKTYGKGYQISMEAQEDDIDAVISDATPALSNVARNSIETELASDFNGAFSTTTTPDGKALCADDHILVGGGSFDNLIASDFSQGALESAINIFRDMRNDRNQLVDMDPAMILYPPELDWIVSEVLQSELKSSTANNAINVVQSNRIGIKQVMWKYLTDADNWFILTQPRMHRIMCYWRTQPRPDYAMDFDTGNLKTKMIYRLSHGAADWRGIVGGQGQ